MDDLLTFDKLVQAVIQRESSGRPDARSSAGAVGLMGIMPGDFMQSPRRNVPSVFDAARSLGFDVQPNQETRETAEMLLADPAVNTMLGEAYLKELMTKYRGDTEGALTSYNAGAAEYDARGSAENMRHQEQREYAQKVSEDYENMFGKPLPQNLGVLVSPRPRPRPKGLLN
jgi:soluble lytic murein transglycosylase-like protein